MSSKAPNWTDQWGSRDEIEPYYDDHQDDNSKNKNKGKKMENVKAVASAGLGKAKGAASVGAQKVKSGTTVGLSWFKNQYHKRTSK